MTQLVHSLPALGTWPALQIHARVAANAFVSRESAFPQGRQIAGFAAKLTAALGASEHPGWIHGQDYRCTV